MRFGSIQDVNGNPISGAPTISVLQSNSYSNGQAVYFNGTDWQCADASDGYKLGIGILGNVTMDGFTVYLAGPIKGLSGLSAGSYYFVSDSSPGSLTTTEPTDPLSYSNPILFATSATEGVVLQYRPSSNDGTEVYYQTVQDNGTDVTQRAKLNFVGATVTDGPNATTITISGGSGSQGAQGAQGDAGPPGHNGTPGAQGAQGDAGPPGTPGESGTPGAQGYQGFQGDNGSFTDVSCRSTSSTSQTIVDTASAVTFDTNEYDTANIHNVSGGGSTQFLIPSDGKYVFTANVRFAANSSGVRKIYWRLNGGATTFIGASASGIASFPLDLCSIFERQFSIGDYVELMAMELGIPSISMDSVFVTVRKVA